MFLDGRERAEAGAGLGRKIIVLSCGPADVILKCLESGPREMLLSNVSSWPHCIRLHVKILGVLVGARVVLDVYLAC